MPPTKRTRLSLFLALALLTLLALVGERRLTTTTAENSNLPQISPPSGSYDTDVLVGMTTPDRSAAILFTTDGSEPRPENSAVYNHPLPVPAAAADITVISARLVWPDGTLGPVTRTTYFLLDTSLPVLSLAVEPSHLTDPQTGLLTNPRQRGMEWERPVHVSYLDTTGETAVLGFTSSAGLRIHGNNSRDYAKKSLRLYFRSEYGQNRLLYPLFTPLPHQPHGAGYKRLVLHSGGQEFNAPGWTLLRTPLVEWLGAHTHAIVAPSRPVLLFINGEPQGIYLLRQRIDEWYFADVHNTLVVDEATHEALWQALREYIADHDMQDPDAYATVTARINVDNFIDYHLLNLYAGNTDWIYANMRRYLPASSGGQWHWLIWDVDWTFGLLKEAGPDFDMLAYFFETENPSFQRGALPLRRLMENPLFRQRFLSRADELLNTILRPDVVTARLDELAAEMAPDALFESARWPSSTSWEAGVAEMRRYAAARPFHFRAHLSRQFNLGDSVRLTIAAPTAGKGGGAIGNWLLPAAWEGEYFPGAAVTVTAVPAPGYRFIGWEEPALPQSATIDWIVSGDQTFTPRFAPQVPAAWQAGDVVIVAAGRGAHPEADVHGSWVELRVMRRGGVDLRGWRLTDADTKTGTGEGALHFTTADSLARVPAGTRLLVVAETDAGRRSTPIDSTTPTGMRILFAGGGQVSGEQAYRFRLGETDNVALLAPGPTDDVGIAFFTLGSGLPAVTPATFGILEDGVTTGMQAMPAP
jgi:hypothetical protein